VSDPSQMEPSRKVHTVPEITKLIRHLLTERFFAVWVTGEVSNLRTPQSGHAYFTLKDKDAQLSCVMFRSAATRLRFALEDGMEIVALGDIDVYEPRGVYQLVVRAIEPKGAGALQIAFEQLKRKLAAEGLFDPSKKKETPFLPAQIAIVTSPTGAAIRDMLRVITSRYPPARVALYPVRVQGEGAAAEIAQAISELNRARLADVIIVGRGGGSLEDLWAFNEESVARSIYQSRIPVISAVGHEIDFTISDMVADVRALTPTHAGQLVVPRLEQLLQTLESAKASLARSSRQRVEFNRAKLDALTRRPGFRQPRELVRAKAQLLDELWASSGQSLVRMVELKKNRAEHLAEMLEELSPLRTLRRGYSVTFKGQGQTPVTDSKSLRPDDLVRTLLATGSFTATVKDIEKGA